MDVLAGIFVGGRGRRMGGVAKGLLRDEGGRPLFAGLRAACEEAGVGVVMVGPAASRVAYAELAEGLVGVDDDPRAEGPLGGLLALLEAGRAASVRCVIALACDMPRVDARAVRGLLAAVPDAAAVAARRGSTWEPFFARYEVARVRPVVEAAAAARRFALQAVLDEVAVAIDVEARVLEDWDAPGDVPIRS